MSFFKKDVPTRKPSFSNVTSGSSTTGDAPSSPGTPGAQPDFSNVRSGASSTAPVHDAPGTTTYVVRSGDSLSKIARRHYGDAKLWPRGQPRGHRQEPRSHPARADAGSAAGLTSHRVLRREGAPEALYPQTGAWS